MNAAEAYSFCLIDRLDKIGRGADRLQKGGCGSEERTQEELKAYWPVRVLVPELGVSLSSDFLQTLKALISSMIRDTYTYT